MHCSFSTSATFTLLSPIRNEEMWTPDKLPWLINVFSRFISSPTVISSHSCGSTGLILMWMPLEEWSVILWISLGFWVGSSIRWYLLSVRAVITFSTFMAKFCPMQFLREENSKSVLSIKNTRGQQHVRAVIFHPLHSDGKNKGCSLIKEIKSTVGTRNEALR